MKIAYEINIKMENFGPRVEYCTTTSSSRWQWDTRSRSVKKMAKQNRLHCNNCVTSITRLLVLTTPANSMEKYISLLYNRNYHDHLLLSGTIKWLSLICHSSRTGWTLSSPVPLAVPTSTGRRADLLLVFKMFEQFEVNLSLSESLNRNCSI